ncbi:membrane-bound lytic murein transglycosylase F [Variovorax paradoxus]|uniref:Membrane-bound lytic murein transglycosylase F n=2 Tax=Variovorax paradoxus TaxID=34073 RepID=A0A0H2M1T8_VARPD|nr:membrane-bound lytic murein transglycosylase F [Variovorax paradoxus]
MPRNAQWWDRRSSVGAARTTPTRYVAPRAATLQGIGRFVLILFGALLLLGGMLACCTANAQTIPREALQHRATLKREAQRVWGLDAPVATFAAQVHQESRWRVDARSPVGAQGLAQFMPSTASWIGGVYPSLGERAPLNPTWALRGLVTYDKWLFDRIKADSECERMAFALSAYNGGLGWVYKRQQRSVEPGVCLGVTCSINPGIHPASQRENAHYPVVILQKHQPLYSTWGRGSCP